MKKYAKNNEPTLYSVKIGQTVISYLYIKCVKQIATRSYDDQIEHLWFILYNNYQLIVTKASCKMSYNLISVLDCY